MEERVKDLKKDGLEWSWTHAGASYRTNGEGEGLFVWAVRYGQLSPEWVQKEGTCDFYLRDMSVSGARKKINRYFADRC